MPGQTSLPHADPVFGLRRVAYGTHLKSAPNMHCARKEITRPPEPGTTKLGISPLHYLQNGFCALIVQHLTTCSRKTAALEQKVSTKAPCCATSWLPRPHATCDSFICRKLVEGQKQSEIVIACLRHHVEVRFKAMKVLSKHSNSHTWT